MAEYELGIIGFGNMGQAIVAGIIKSGFLAAETIAVYDADPAKLLSQTQNYGLSPVDIESLASESKNILLAVKPQQIGIALDSIKESVANDTLILSIAAGVKIGKLSKALAGRPVIRCMPNTPAFVSKSITAIAASENCSKDNLTFATGLFSSIGKVVMVKEHEMDAVTAVSGSGPAYFFEFTRLIGISAQSLGLSQKNAAQLAIETLIGSAELVNKSGKSLEELRDMVTSKGGTTEAALSSFSANGFDSIIQKALKAARDKAKELSD